jgi:hypothetical protein
VVDAVKALLHDFGVLSVVQLSADVDPGYLMIGVCDFRGGG